jgi:small-conductance mechanosensitive channel
MQNLTDRALVEPFRRLADQLASALPPVATVAVILLLGGVLAFLLRRLLFRVLTLVKFDRLAGRTAWGSAVLRTGLFASVSDFVARAIQGLLWLFMILLALSAAHTSVTDDLVTRFFSYVPDLVTAVLVLLLASVISKFLARSTLLAAVNAQWTMARPLAGAVRVLVMCLGILVALEQLRIGRTALLVTFAILFAGIVMALAIAFGLGARDLVRDWLQTNFRDKAASDQELSRHL